MIRRSKDAVRDRAATGLGGGAVDGALRGPHGPTRRIPRLTAVDGLFGIEEAGAPEVFRAEAAGGQA
ncbi:hypothetical protein PSU4_59980 [Pseudonocardia sulfidoxydans NBRC 16205]|uniref:Uncharacterized protein n=1 Tax=Pseudonocardia sulfidoxydans NBRC 16205 TaxID=1223511 RepID=A0A511DTE5_9PSEU|nr:hypothetical protein [Pseudonocardia sulfidoxydans]GEL27044.1 hypothetical protein PSU4_59980 [Pseudonocardia sulfidoxydans NBRC 16205]